MTDLVRIDDEVITSDDFVKILKLAGRFDGLMEEILKEKLTVHAGKRQGISIDPQELQERADQLRRVWGLHRAADTNKWLDAKEMVEYGLVDKILEHLPRSIKAPEND